MNERVRRIMRNEKRRWRQGLSQEEVKRNSRIVVGHLLRLDPLVEASVVMGYLAIENEIDVWPFLEWCLRQGKTVALPRIDAAANRIEAARFTGWEGLRKGKFGLMEPEGEPLAPEFIDAVLVPGVVFDMRGYRLGYGKGYYDRFLPQLKGQALAVGVAHSHQVVDEIPRCSHDYRLDYLVTEKGVTRFREG